MKKIYLFCMSLVLILSINPLFSAEILCEFGHPSYLAINGTVSKNSYQMAFFGTQDYLNANKETYSKEFTIIPENDGTEKVRIKSMWGEDSYLAIDGLVKKGSYQRAFFGTQDYLDANKETYCSKFTLESNSIGKVRIKGMWGDGSYLAINGTVSKNSYQRAFFGTQDYLDANKETYCSLLKIVPANENIPNPNYYSSMGKYIKFLGVGVAIGGVAAYLGYSYLANPAPSLWYWFR